MTIISFLKYCFESSKIYDSEISSFEEIINWIEHKLKNTRVKIKLVDFEKCSHWFHDKKEGSIKNDSNAFFSITGAIYNNGEKTIDQPIIIQNEIGYLGIVCKIINGTLYFLMQAKIEPGNVNVVQISPTLQATKSNFTKKHGGLTPNYFELFNNCKSDEIMVDQIQSEQASRFFRKRNRNIVIYTDEEIEVLPDYHWMTLGQIKKMLEIDNLVNMDTRTVLSCIPFHLYCNCGSVLNNSHIINYFREAQKVYSRFNSIKMFSETKLTFCDPFELPNWLYDGKTIHCMGFYPFEVVFSEIEIENREVKKWCQPLVRSCGSALFILVGRKCKDSYEFLVCPRKEVGSYDSVELGPSVQCEAGCDSTLSIFEKEIINIATTKEVIIYDHYLSEEGGRFYHEQNRNIVCIVDDNDWFLKIPDSFFWCNLKTLNFLCQINNVVNIQLRNLLVVAELEVINKND